MRYLLVSSVPSALQTTSAVAPSPSDDLAGPLSEELADQDLTGDVEILDAHMLYPERFGKVPPNLIRPFATGQGGMVYYAAYKLRPGHTLPVAVKFALSVENSVRWEPHASSMVAEVMFLWRCPCFACSCNPIALRGRFHSEEVQEICLSCYCDLTVGLCIRHPAGGHY